MQMQRSNPMNNANSSLHNLNPAKSNPKLYIHGPNQEFPLTVPYFSIFRKSKLHLRKPKMVMARLTFCHDSACNRGITSSNGRVFRNSCHRPLMHLIHRNLFMNHRETPSRAILRIGNFPYLYRFYGNYSIMFVVILRSFRASMF